MSSPYGLKIIESCLACPVRHERLLCNLSPDALRISMRSPRRSAMDRRLLAPKGR
jgi:hypothetical protein